MTQPNLRSVLDTLTRERLFDLGRVTGAGLRPSREAKRGVVAALAETLGEQRLPEVLVELGRDELRAVCRAHGLADDDRKRTGLMESLLRAAGFDPAASIRPPPPLHDGLPEPGQVLAARGRQWLVEVVERGEGSASPLLTLACLDDDAPGRRLQMLWDLELGARVIAPEAHGLGTPDRLDPPSHFGAYLHALKWSAVSAADVTRFQAPFRAGIKLMPHQLTPLMKALELPRANLFIADDVGLGKTIEAGLVLQELIMRQQADFVLIVCPASVGLQWRDEMMRRFGLRFELMTRAFIAQRRRQRGFGVNPWATHNRFIVSHPLMRRPEYRDSLLAHLGHRAEKGLLILDEAHVAAPASASKYAVDSDTTRTIRDLAPKFDNRLFLSATPHNGHSNSFSALLESLDPVRFTRGVRVTEPAMLEPVMVRRLKRDLRQLDADRFPERILCRLSLTHQAAGGWSAAMQRYSADTAAQSEAEALASELGGDHAELELTELLARYTELCAPDKGKGRLVFINLQKRLLSSPEAFAHTIEVHAESVEKAGGVKVNAAHRQLVIEIDAEAYGEDDEAIAAEEDAAVAAATALLPSPSTEAAALLKQMRRLAAKARRTADGKVRALLAWLQAHCCPALALGGDEAGKPKDAERNWTDRRVILFTEYADTKRYLQDLLGEAVAGTDRGDERILTLHGGMGDDARDEVQRAFNAHPDAHPVRILIATDAAREGVNLQAHCADLFHMDVPWNPSRLEQRNGRIDRTLQPAPEVRCHYFVYSQRGEDRVLDTLFRKVQTIQSELGSVGAVLLDKIEATLSDGIRRDSADQLELMGTTGPSAAAEAELESQRKQLDRLQAEIQRAGQRLERSRRALQVDANALRGVVDIGLRMAGADGLTEGARTTSGRQSYVLPRLDRSWEVTLDSLRPTRGRKEPLWEWRDKPPRAVTFEPLATMSEEAEQLHLAHPLVRRILDRFAAQGFGAHDLSRVCAVRVPGENVARVLAYARLTLFGRGAARLHDELVTVVAPWAGSMDEPIQPYKDSVTAARARDATEAALATGAVAPKTHAQERSLAHATAVFAQLWPRLEAEADARAVEARAGLGRRARKESDDLKALLQRQRTALLAAHEELRQTTLFEVQDLVQKRQVELDIQHLASRRDDFDRQLEEEPRKIEALYEVQMTRVSPVGLVFAWPGEGA